MCFHLQPISSNIKQTLIGALHRTGARAVQRPVALTNAQTATRGDLKLKFNFNFKSVKLLTRDGATIICPDLGTKFLSVENPVCPKSSNCSHTN